MILFGFVVGVGWGYALFSGRVDLARGGSLLMRAAGDLAQPFCEVSGWLFTGDVATVRQAYGWFSQALRNDAGLAQAYLLRGQAACLLGDYAAAVTDLGMFTRLQPDNPLGWVELGFALDALGSVDAAAVAWRRAGLNAEVFLQVAQKFKRQQAYAEALRWLRYAEQFDAVLPGEQAFLAYLALRDRDIEQARAQLVQAVTLDYGWLDGSSRLDAWRFWGQYLYESRQYSLAHEALQNALRVAPVDAAPAALSETYRFLGLSDWALNDFDAAAAAFEQAVDVFPESVWAQVHFAVFRYEIGQFSSAQVQQVFDVVLQANADHEALWRYVIKFWQEAGEPDLKAHYCKMQSLNAAIVDLCNAAP